MDIREINAREEELSPERREVVKDAAWWVAKVLSNRKITAYEMPVVLERCQDYLTVTAGDQPSID